MIRSYYKYDLRHETKWWLIETLVMEALNLLLWGSHHLTFDIDVQTWFYMLKINITFKLNLNKIPSTQMNY